MPFSSPSSRRFDVALSFPGEHRDFVEKVARRLAASFGEERVLYDKYHDAEFARADLDVYLPNLYRTQSELIVIFLCPEYAPKRWCKLEWRHIRQLIATADEGRIMFLSFGDPGDVSGLGILSGDGYIDIIPLTPQVVAEKIIKRLCLNQSTSSPPTPTLVPISTGKFDISRILKYAPSQLIGREEELKLLNDARTCGLKSPIGDQKNPCRPHVLTFVALGGEGKTALVAKWAVELAAQNWPGCEAALAWSFYSQGAGEKVAADSDLFLKAALNFFAEGDPKEEEIRDFAASPVGVFEKGQRLARLVGQRRSLLILDGLEPLQYAPTAPTPGELKDQGVAALLKGLAQNSQGLCIVTTRYSLPDLKAFRQTAAPEVKLLRLSRDAGVHLLQTLGVRGSELRNILLKEGDEKSEKVNEFEKLVEDVKGHALTLTLLGTYLRDAHSGDIRKRDFVKLEEADTEEQGGHAFRIMEAYERAFEQEGDKGKRALSILRLLGLFDRPITADCFAALLKAPAIRGLTDPVVRLSEAQRNITLTRLEDAKLITVRRDASANPQSLDAHPLLREYFAKQLCEKNPKAWRAGHKRLYEHLCASTKEGNQPTLEDLQPLYQAIAHGCQAGMHRDAANEVFLKRLYRSTDTASGFYSMFRLGAYSTDLSALACFFEMPWTRLSHRFTKRDQAWLLHQTAYVLAALGRLAEALDPLGTSVEQFTDEHNWLNAAGSTATLSEVQLMLGNLLGALNAAEQAVEFADRAGRGFDRASLRTTIAKILHQMGRIPDALEHYRLAEMIWAETFPTAPLLSSTWGFSYCDLLLAEAERAAWQRKMSFDPRKTIEGDGCRTLIARCREVEDRATHTLRWKEEQKTILDIALDHLTLGRAGLYEAILTKSEVRIAKIEVEQAVAGLRRAGQQDYVISGLLTRAWLRYLTGACTGPGSAQADLDEAWEIAERGPMRLFLADIHLYHARLFGGEKGKVKGEKYPWESPVADLAAARKLIEQCCYWRRKEELKDAEGRLRQQRS